MNLIVVGETTQIFQSSTRIKLFYDIKNAFTGPNVFQRFLIQNIPLILIINPNAKKIKKNMIDILNWHQNSDAKMSASKGWCYSLIYPVFYIIGSYGVVLCCY